MGTAKRLASDRHLLARLTRNEVGKARRWPIPEDGGGSSDYTITFQIISMSSPSIRIALVSVLSVSNGLDPANLPGLDALLSNPADDLYILEVADPLGCYFNEPAGLMVGRSGWAKYMTPIVLNVCQPYGTFDPQWEVFALCCAEAECGEI